MRHYKIKKSITSKEFESLNIYLKEISKYKLLTIKQEQELTKKAELGDIAAQKTLVESNLRFVISIAKQYQSPVRLLPDLVSYGNIGLIQAVKTYKSSFNVRFLSYAVWWIRKNILKAISEYQSLIRLPDCKAYSLHKLEQSIEEFEQAYGYTPTEEDLADIMEIDPNDVHNLIQSQINVISETTTNNDGEEVSIFNQIEYTDEAVDSNKRIQLLKLLKTELTPTEYIIITALFGFNEDYMSSESLENKLNITKERIRQIKDKAILKLRNSPKLTQLLNYLY